MADPTAPSATPGKLSDPDRLRALASSLLLDRAADGSFDQVTRLLARLLGVPVALVSLVDDRRQILRSRVGLQVPETPLSHSFCQHVVIDEQPLVIEDARLDPLVSENLAVSELDVVAYAGWPLRLDGHVIGSLCAIDTRPRRWTARQLSLLEELARLAEQLIELRRQALDERRVTEERQSEQEQVDELSRRLQRALLPRRLNDGQVWATYRPGERRLLLGGDFADVHVTPDGATEFVIGDVSGHGPEAAALATALRASWGTLRRLGQPLEEMLAALDDVVVAERADDELFATVLVGRVSRTGALRVGSAGHPLPVVVGAEPREVAGRPGMLLGTGLEARRPVSEQQLDGPLLVYTDGLTDGRAEPGDRLRFGLDGLLAAVAEHASDAPEALIGSVIATATAAHGEPLADDVTVLLVGHDGGGP